eukprot:Pompholyxophrys_sp_v1_NODE_13_length_4899_cov_11.419162.p4 type:complete len:106 gc:universal NODE_13_length_4899_cov_11.419162:871-554(-)
MSSVTMDALTPTKTLPGPVTIAPTASTPTSTHFSAPPSPDFSPNAELFVPFLASSIPFPTKLAESCKCDHSHWFIQLDSRLSKIESLLTSGTTKKRVGTRIDNRQ